MSEEFARLGVVPARLRGRDLYVESVLAVVRHPGRSLLTAIGTVLGAAAFVATLGLSSTVSAQVSESFDLQRATEVGVTPAADAAPDDARWQEPAALDRLRGVAGVVDTGARITVPDRTIRRSAESTAIGVGAAVVGADPGALAVMAPRLRQGRLHDQFHEDNASPVVLLPAPLAQRLSVDRTGVAVFLDGQPYTVIGIFDDLARREESLLSAVVPFRVLAEQLPQGADDPSVFRDVIIEAAPGAAAQVGRQAPLALRPEGPAALDATAPPDLQSLRRTVEADVTQLSVLLSLVALAIGAVSIANAATAGIAARVPEIGLRRAVGARPRHIFVQLTAETTALGTMGGFAGTVLGVLVTSVVALFNGWAPVLDLTQGLLATAAGAAAGLLAGMVPAVRATRIPPVAALQR